MNKRTFSIAIILAGLVGILTFACDRKDSPPSGDGAQTLGENSPEAVPGVVMHGTVEWSDSEGLVLFDGMSRYGLKGDSDLNRFIGREIKVTGILDTDDSGSFIQVVQALEEQDNLMN